MHPNMAPLDMLEPVATQKIGTNNHPKADSLINRAHRGATDRGMYVVGTRFPEGQFHILPSGEPMFVTRAVVELMDDSGERYTFEGWGDASPGNCSSPQTGLAFPRMAATRALGRALCDGLNISEAVAEEMIANMGGSPAVGGTAAAPAPAAVAGRDPNIPVYNFKVPFGNHKDKDISDPTMGIPDLQWLLENNPQTGYPRLAAKNPNGLTDANGKAIYDVPNTLRQQCVRDEINRRMSGSPAVTQPQATPAAAPQVAQPQAAPAPAPAGDGAFVAQPYIAHLIQVVKAAGSKMPDAMAWSNDTFGVVPAKITDKDMFNMLLANYGGAPIA